MTSTPVSINDESLNGSWIDINSASQIHSPMDDDLPEFLRPPSMATETSPQIGISLSSFQVERFLQGSQRNQPSNSYSQQNSGQPIGDDNNSELYTSDTDVSIDDLDSKTLINNLRKHHHHRQKKLQLHQQQQQQQQQQQSTNESNNNNDLHSKLYPTTATAMMMMNNCLNQKLSKSGDFSADQLSDSLSLLSRASAINEPDYDQTTSLQDFDWLWDWTAQPEYFTGQEWKVYAPKQEYLMRQRQLYYANLNHDHGETLFSGEVISLLFLTNILSIIIGAGLTYSILMRRPTV